MLPSGVVVFHIRTLTAAWLDIIDVLAPGEVGSLVDYLIQAIEVAIKFFRFPKSNQVGLAQR
ncbi:MAG TPA: hypothetical protein VIQ75_10145, partial [Gammaproteobacteria bacterium]